MEANLSTNNLTGSIPSIIGNLTNIINLQLNNNQLSGIIPEEICNSTKSHTAKFLKEILDKKYKKTA